MDMISQAEAAVKYATRSAVYTLDAEGNPTDTGVQSALRDAADAQFQALELQMGADATNAAAAGASVLGRPLKSASIGGASWPADDAASTIPVRYQIPYGGLCYAAVEILSHAGLLGGEVGVRG